MLEDKKREAREFLEQTGPCEVANVFHYVDGYALDDDEQLELFKYVESVMEELKND